MRRVMTRRLTPGQAPCSDGQQAQAARRQLVGRGGKLAGTGGRAARGRQQQQGVHSGLPSWQALALSGAPTLIIT